MSAVAKRLSGKTVVVTGASSGIGRSVAFEFARAAAPAGGLRLILTARRIDALRQIADELVKELGEDKVQVLPVQLDISDRAAVRGFVANLPEEWRDIDVLVNNAYVLSSLSFLAIFPRCPRLFLCPRFARFPFAHFFVLASLASFARSLLGLLTIQWPRQGRCPCP